MSIAKFNTVELPRVTVAAKEPKFIGDRVRLAGGKMHQDFVAIKRVWRLESKYITKTQADAIVAELDNNNWRVDFWYDEFGVGVTVTAYINIRKEERVNFIDENGTRHNDGKTIVFEIIEE